MITKAARARLKVLNEFNIEAGVLRELIIKELHQETIVAINDKLRQLSDQNMALLEIKNEIEELLQPRRDDE